MNQSVCRGQGRGAARGDYYRAQSSTNSFRKRFSISCQTDAERLGIFMRPASEICPYNTCSRQQNQQMIAAATTTKGAARGTTAREVRRSIWAYRLRGGTFFVDQLSACVCPGFVRLDQPGGADLCACLCVYLGPVLGLDKL